jgi:hypothetical protein
VIDRFLAGNDHGQPQSMLVGGLLEECGDKGYLRRFYSKDVLMSDEARRRWVPPDLCPLESPLGHSSSAAPAPPD